MVLRCKLGALFRVRGIMVRLLIIGFMVHKAEAASIVVNPPDAYGRTFIDVFGELVLDDVKTFQDVVRGLAERDKIIVSLNGPGGEAIALQIGELIRLSGMKTYVAPNGTCESVCAFIWLAGNPRYAGTGANIGFHGVYNQNTALPGKFNLITATYLGYLDLPTSSFVDARRPQWLCTCLRLSRKTVQHFLRGA